MGGMYLKLDYAGDPGLWMMIVGVILIVGLGAGAYPALVLSRFRPAAVLASARSPGGGRGAGRVREGLVAFQFAIAIAFTISTAVMVGQTAYVRHAKLGFSRHGLIVVPSLVASGLTEAQRNTLMAAWRATPGVVSATEASDAPGAALSLSTA